MSTVERRFKDNFFSMNENPPSIGPDLRLGGVVGVVGGEAPEDRRRLWSRLRSRLGGIEVRADLFPDAAGALACLDEATRMAPVIFTARNPAEGGKFRGSEAERLDLYRKALARGAALVDAEWGTEACAELARSRAPLLVSHHD